MNVKALLTYFLLGGMLISCIPQRAWTTEDSWYNPPPEGTPGRQWSELDRTRIHEVTESKEPDAERLLQDASIVELTDQEAVELIGKALPDAPGTKPYLTRGLYLNRGTGRFSVYILEDQLVVHHGSLGSSAVPMKRQALVLQLEQSPVEVFVICSMAE